MFRFISEPYFSLKVNKYINTIMTFENFPQVILRWTHIGTQILRFLRVITNSSINIYCPYFWFSVVGWIGVIIINGWNSFTNLSAEEKTVQWVSYRHNICVTEFANNKHFFNNLQINPKIPPRFIGTIPVFFFHFFSSKLTPIYMFPLSHWLDILTQRKET